MSDPSPELDATGVTTENPDAAAATSSSAEPEGVKSLIDMVSTALDGSEKSPASDEPGTDVSATKPDDGASAEKSAEDPTEDELKLYSQNAQNRIRELVQRRKEVEGQLEPIRQEVEQLRPRAESMDKLNDYLRENRISPDQMNNTMAIAAMVQTGRYQEALQAIGPIYEQLLQLTGNVLPKDLQQEVEAGYITTNRALELQRERMANQTARQREKQQNDEREAQRHRETSERQSRMYGSEATAWENAKKQSDPDWSTKQKLVSDLMESELRRIAMTDPAKLPADPKAVHKFLDSILERVEGHIKPFRPKPTPIEHETGRPASAGAKSKPASLMDAVNAALN